MSADGNKYARWVIWWLAYMHNIPAQWSLHCASPKSDEIAGGPFVNAKLVDVVDYLAVSETAKFWWGSSPCDCACIAVTGVSPFSISPLLVAFGVNFLRCPLFCGGICDITDGLAAPFPVPSKPIVEMALEFHWGRFFWTRTLISRTTESPA